MNQVKLELNLESYFYSRAYKSIYFSGKLLNNIIFDNQIVEEKSAKVKVVFKPDNPHSYLKDLHENLSPNKFSFPVQFEVDISSVTKPLNKEGVRISTFQAI